MIRILLFDIATYAINALPPKYRLSKFVLWMQSILYGLTWNYNMLQVYRTSTVIAAYNSGTTYAANTMVVYNFTIYISLKAANTGNTPSTNPAFWYTMAGNFIGLTERIKYTGSYLPLTWALNRYFSTTFRQPPYPAPYGGSGTFSDIYITNQTPVITSFVMYPNAFDSSAMYPTYSTGAMYDPPVYGSASTYKFTIHIPTAVFTALGATTAIRTAIVNKFVATYAVAGTTWNIVTY